MRGPPDDLAVWESERGPSQNSAIVAMNSGWDAFVGDSKFRNADDAGVMHFPVFTSKPSKCCSQAPRKGHARRYPRPRLGPVA